MNKLLKDVFKDYTVGGNITEAEITNINVFKKTNKVLIQLQSAKQILLEDFVQFESYLKSKFGFSVVRYEIKYLKDFKYDVLNDWAKILEYLAQNYPLTKAIFNHSTFEIDGNEFKIYIKYKNATEILCTRKIDLVMQNLLSILSGKEYKILYIEKIDKNSEEKFLMEQEKLQRQAIIEAKKFAIKEAEERVEKIAFQKEQEKIRKEEEQKKIEQEAMDSLAKGDLAVVEKTETKNPIIYGRLENLKGNLVKIKTLTENSGEVLIEGEIIGYDVRELKTGKQLITFNVFDGSSTITCKIFAPNAEKSKEIQKRLKESKGIKLKGEASFDQYAKEVTIMTRAVIETQGFKREKRMDNSENKRVELHLHTQMSQMDAVSSVSDLIKRAKEWGMKSIAITDHGVVQAFPDAKKATKDSDIKVIYGVEAYLVPDKNPIVFFPKNQKIDTEYCVFDIETTGLAFRTEKITEIGAVKIKNGEIIEEFSTFVNPEKPIPQHIVEITNITDEMVKNAPKIEEVMPKLLEFFGNSVLVAHNAGFDIGFLKYNANLLGLSIENTYIDTLSLSRCLYPHFKKHKLGIIAENLGIKVEVAHRALDDVYTLIKVFNEMLKVLITEKNIQNISEIEDECSKNIDVKKLEAYHAIILTKNYAGLKNLYKLVSFSHLDYYYRKPRIPKSLYTKYSDGLMIGTACEAGELYRAIIAGKTDEEIEEIAKFYDYLEIQPIANNGFLLRNGMVADNEGLRDINRKIVKLGEKLDMMVVATGDVHFLDPEDEIYRRILLAGQGYEDADAELPLYFKTTEEMLEEFSYLGEEKAYEIVVTNTNKISELCEPISPISKDKCPPEIEGSEKELKEMSEKKAHELYGENLPQIVQERMEKELNSIIKNGFAVMYMIAQKLVWKSNSDGYLVGSRGSVGSSFVAYLSGITEVNALPPHYRCPSCKYSDFEDYGIKNGIDLPKKECPKCGTMLVNDGMDIPFETFLGFDGDKEPDIDLNFSGEYQAKAHRYVDELFKDGSTFKAGTIGTIADKTAYGYVKKYFEEREISVSSAEITRLATGCTGVKRTTGQHPGGIIVVPAGREIYEFCPVQHPADDPNSDIITTHFDYHSIDKNLLKLDILGHDDPTVIRMLQDITGIDPQTIPLDDKETMSLFSGTEALGVTSQQINSQVGTYGIPEFGTKFVRGMLVDTIPTTFEELIRISGLSHGTDVWLNNAQDLIKNKTTTLSEAICTRDDIMIYLIKAGLPNKMSFVIMESVRKGKGLTPEMEECMKENNVPEWYINSCKKIKYMFPKAHAAAYVTMAFRIAWFKVHLPMAYYTAYYSIRADDFDSEIMIHGEDRVKEKMKEIEELGNATTQKDKNTYAILEIVMEMYERGLKFLPIDLYKSHATKFIMEENGIRPPLNSIAGLGTVAALKIDEAKEQGAFMCIEDLKEKSGVGKSIIELLEKSGCLEGMPKSNQISLF